MDQLLSAIAVVSDPTQNRELQAQAIEYLNTIRTTPQQSWQLALALFVDAKPDGTRTHDPQIRAFALQILDDLLETGYVLEKIPSSWRNVGPMTCCYSVEPLDQTTSDTLRDAFKSYIRSEYAFGSAESHAPCQSCSSSPQNSR